MGPKDGLKLAFKNKLLGISLRHFVRPLRRWHGYFSFKKTDAKRVKFTIYYEFPFKTTCFKSQGPKENINMKKHTFKGFT